MNATYKAIEVSKPGEFSQVQKSLVDPGRNQVRIRVEACGVCHSDSGTVEGLFPISWPRVPGHEVVGRIEALGSGVRAGRLVSASASASSEALAVIANSVEMAIS
jgi:alcohol dehydrogenase, propanol-preferring